MGIGILIVLIASVYKRRRTLWRAHSRYIDKISGLYSKRVDTKRGE